MVSAVAIVLLSILFGVPLRQIGLALSFAPVLLPLS